MSNITLDAPRMATTAADVSPQGEGVILTQTLAKALFGTKSVNVTTISEGDLEALVARLRNEEAQARFSLVLSSLNSLGQSLTDVQKQRLQEGVTLAKKLEELQETLGKQTGDEAEAKAAAMLLQAKIEQLQKQIEQAVKDGKEHNKLVEEQERARAELKTKEQLIADTQGQIAETKNAISSVKGKISAIVNSIGENTLKAIAKEIADLADPEKADRPAETEKSIEKEARNDPLAAIRDSLDRMERDLLEAIETNRTAMV